MKNRVRVALLLLAAGVVAACGSGSPTSTLNEIARVRSSNLDVVLLSERPAIQEGQDIVTLEFRSAEGGNLVDVGVVKGSATMPMAGMAPMVGGLAVQRGNVPGRYTASSDLSMAGEWRVGLEWDGPSGRGSATIPISAQ